MKVIALPKRAIRFIDNKIRVHILDEYMVWRARNILSKNETFMLNLPSHTINENKKIWDSYDWSNGGEEWTLHSETYRGIDPTRWKSELVNGMILKYIKNESTILEIGPGAGRWTEILQGFARRLILADISERCLDICKQRFKESNNLEYHLIKNRLDFIDDASIDFIWSYDVFVHINPTDIERYLECFQRILKTGGCAIIHHSGGYPNNYLRRASLLHFRSYMNGNLFAHLVRKYGMTLVEQNDTLTHLPYDLISVFYK